MQSEKHKNTFFPRSKETKTSALLAHIEKGAFPIGNSVFYRMLFYYCLPSRRNIFFLYTSTPG